MLRAVERRRAARNPEDVRLLQGDDRLRAHRSSCVCGGASRVDGFAEAARRALRRPGRAAESVQDRRVRRGAPRRWTRRTKWRRRRRSPSASRCGGRGTDDSHQPPRRRTRAAEAPELGRAFDIGQKVTLVCSLILVAAALGIGWWWWALDRATARLDGEIARRAARDRAAADDPPAGRHVRQAEAAAAAARRADRGAAQRAGRAVHMVDESEQGAARHAVAHAS